MLTKHGARDFNISRGLEVFRAIVLITILALSFNGYVSAMELAQPESSSEMLVMHAQDEATHAHDERSCLLCDMGCHCHTALPLEHIFHQLRRPVSRHTFEIADFSLPSADMPDRIKPPRMG